MPMNAVAMTCGTQVMSGFDVLDVISIEIQSLVVDMYLPSKYKQSDRQGYGSNNHGW